MGVTIGEISSELVVDPSKDRGAGAEAGPAPAQEVRVEELRAIVRELLVEELERYLRLAVDR
ncbi:hypothetical protein [Caulobacter radicis]|uniref:hypothetical protein n=1 Tax=Caulobacter radicis TaxID=2172650 RepID=UPI001402F68D|nr:hypothetical protein [Caulobacter radicis]